jgi:hypothetical protein
MAEAMIAASGRPMPLEEARRAATAVWASVHGVVSLVLAGRIDAALSVEEVVDEIIQAAVDGTCSPEGPVRQ